ncbi:SNF2 family N-terminal domain-domain-containing protein [Clohesyomyces aquaticus]|uniref:SNF2 family N-terminal domain-domain-containing protein n=1 Tax=Clohesyomyces aquaticus TaxID=1231657 RepID=A0A1Y1YQY5_9PLEO|nr:SNF2 family N-terminal domain-domain-containing protein [Clohesyomyces aquaticus]
MLDATLPSIAAESLPDRPTKRRRLEPTRQDQKLDQTIQRDKDAISPFRSRMKLEFICNPVVCYGMIIGLPVHGSYPTIPTLDSTTRVPVAIGPRHKVLRCTDGQHIGVLDDAAGETLAELNADSEIELQLSLSKETASSKSSNKRAFWSLEVILYGPKSRADNVGDFVADSGHYLQDPTGCNRNAPYFNPQRLASLDENLPMTFDLQQGQSYCVNEFARVAKDLLAGFETSNDIAQTATPSALRTQLRLHQRQALSFFKKRELGLSPLGTDAAVWVQKPDAGGCPIYVNTISNQEQSEPPPLWRGGILADDMGLGKTLSMVALIASSLEAGVGSVCPRNNQVGLNMVPSTLVVVPPNVLPVWENQLKLHTHVDTITWMKHRGKERFNHTCCRSPPNIVFTTYQTVEYEYRKSRPHDGSIFSFHWDRVVLDEDSAHIIRNWRTSTAEAVSSLHATNRWALSGTPIQNNLDDFFGLFRFLRFHPYDDPTIFNGHILKGQNDGQVEEPIEKFKRLLSCVMIRRQKSTAAIELPPRQDRIVRIPFDAEEHAYYRSIEQPTTESLNATGGTGSGGVELTLNALQQINKLRIACNLGLPPSSPERPPARPFFEVNDFVPEALRTRLCMGDTCCDQCLEIVDFSGASLVLEVAPVTDAYYSSCGRLFCSSCARLLRFSTPEPCSCDMRDSSCPLRSISMDGVSSRLTPAEGCPSPTPFGNPVGRISSKVRALVAEIQAPPAEKSVVFSFWTSSLDMVEHALQLAGICHVRVDGKVASKMRTKLLDRFNRDPDVRVVLMTVSCGAVGLDLTAASRAHMLEPQWNPSIEEQAMARIYRIGQTREVTTIRYVMDDSLEEHILNVQDRKKLLATLLLHNNSSR